MFVICLVNDVFRLLEGIWSLVGLMDCIVFIILVFFCVLNFIIIIFFRFWVLGINLKIIIFFFFSRILIGVYLIKEVINVLFFGVINVKFFLILVIVFNVLLFFIMIFVFGIFFLFLLRIWLVILIFFFCWGVFVVVLVIVIWWLLMLYFNFVFLDKIFKIDFIFCLFIEIDIFFCSIGKRFFEYKMINLLFFLMYLNIFFIVLLVVWSVKIVCWV